MTNRATKFDRQILADCAVTSAAGYHISTDLLRHCARSLTRDGVDSPAWLRRFDPRDRQRLAQLAVAL